MTIRISVENLDTRDGAVISVQEFSSPDSSGTLVELNAGESVDKYVHSGQYVVVREVKQP